MPALAAAEEAAMRKNLTSLLINERGLAAIEFAFVLPIILSMFLGLVELSHALGVRADVINMTSAGADLVAQEAAASGSDLDTVFSAVTSMLYPHDTTVAVVTITSVIDGGNGKLPVVAWSCSIAGSNAGSGPAPATKGNNPSPAIPAGIITAGQGGSVIWSRVTYRYNSFLVYFLPQWTTWTNDFYSKPRRVLQIPLSTAATAPAKCNM
jgi:Flp pilus assembly protein TadG